MEKNKTCSFFGHRVLFDDEEELKTKLKTVMIDLIENKNVGAFWMGSQGKFDFLCQKVATELKSIYPFLQRVYCCEDPKLEANPIKRARCLPTEKFDEFVYLSMRYKFFINGFIFATAK